MILQISIASSAALNNIRRGRCEWGVSWYLCSSEFVLLVAKSDPGLAHGILATPNHIFQNSIDCQRNIVEVSETALGYHETIVLLINSLSCLILVFLILIFCARMCAVVRMVVDEASA